MLTTASDRHARIRQDYGQITASSFGASNLLVPVILSLPAIYLNTPLTLYVLIGGVALFCGLRSDILAAFLSFFVLIYLLPQDILTTQYNQEVLGGYIGNSFVSLPMIVLLPKIIIDRQKVPPSLAFVLLLLFVPFATSTLLPGTLALVNATEFLGIGASRVRFAYCLNFLNGFFVAVFAYYALRNEAALKLFIRVVLLLATTAATIGLIQYFLQFYFFNYTYAYPQVERLSILSSVDPVDMFPYLGAPFAFAVASVLRGERTHRTLAFLTLALCAVAIIFSWSRWSVFSLAATFVATALAGRRVGRGVIGLIVIATLASLSADWIWSQAVERDQSSRLDSSATLSGRVDLMLRAATVLSERWINGVGLGNTATAANEAPRLFEPSIVAGYAPNLSIVSSIHSFFLDWIVAMGAFAAIGIVALYAVTIRRLVGVARTTGRTFEGTAAAGAFGTLIGLTTFWLQNTGDTYWWLFLSLGMSFRLAGNMSNQAPPDAGMRLPVRTTRR